MNSNEAIVMYSSFHVFMTDVLVGVGQSATFSVLKSLAGTCLYGIIVIISLLLRSHRLNDLCNLICQAFDFNHLRWDLSILSTALLVQGVGEGRPVYCNRYIDNKCCLWKRSFNLYAIFLHTILYINLKQSSEIQS